MRAGTETTVRRMVPTVALTSLGSPVSVAAARVRLNAITAQTSDAAFAVNQLEGRCARAEFFRSACLLDDRVLTVQVVGGDSIEVVGVGGGEERMEPPDIEQRALTLVFLRSQVGDTPHDRPPGDLMGLLLGGERGERGLGDLRTRDQGVGVLVVEGVGAFDRRPHSVVD